MTPTGFCPEAIVVYTEPIIELCALPTFPSKECKSCFKGSLHFVASLSFEAMSLQIFAWESQPLEENKDLSEIGFQQA